MIVEFENREWLLDLDDVDVMQSRKIKRETGMTLLDLEEALERVDPDAMVALYWLMKNQNGVAVDFHKVNFKIVAFGKAIVLAQNRAAQEEAENPTVEAVAETPAPAM